MNSTVASLDIKIVGAMLIIVGLVGLALSLLCWSSFAPFARRTSVVEMARNTVDHS